MENNNLPTVIRKLRITAADGKNDFSETNIQNFRQFYLTFPSDEKLYAPRRELVWSHYRMILPTEEEHKAELEREKSLILEQKRFCGTGKRLSEN